MAWFLTSQGSEQCAAAVGSVPFSGIPSQQTIIAQCGRVATTSTNTRMAPKTRANGPAVVVRDMELTIFTIGPGVSKRRDTAHGSV